MASTSAHEIQARSAAAPNAVASAVPDDALQALSRTRFVSKSVRRVFRLRAASHCLALSIMALGTSSALAQGTAAISSTVAALPISGLEVVEGDILREVTVSSARTLAMRAIAQYSPTRLWADGIVPYRLHSELSGQSIDAIEQAVSHWNRNSGITLLSLHEWPAALPIPDDSVLFQPGDGCASWVGRRGGVQEVWMAPNCNAGSVMHEIGHLLGLEHEHTRPDRDQHIRINWENIDAEKHHNFDAAPVGTMMLGDYDHGSIMHYGPMNFSANGEATITALTDTDVTMGQRLGPSEGDLEAIAALYAADLSIVTQTSPIDTGSEIGIQVSNSAAQGAHDIEVTVIFGQARLRTHVGEDWQCRSETPGLAVCTLPRLEAGSHTQLYLELDTELEASRVSAEVRSKTPDKDPANNNDGLVPIQDPNPGPLPEPAEALSALEDPVVTSVTTSESITQLGAGAWLWLLLGASLLNRLSGLRINRLAAHGIE